MLFTGRHISYEYVNFSSINFGAFQKNEHAIMVHVNSVVARSSCKSKSLRKFPLQAYSFDMQYSF